MLMFKKAVILLKRFYKAVKGSHEDLSILKLCLCQPGAKDLQLPVLTNNHYANKPANLSHTALSKAALSMYLTLIKMSHAVFL